MNKFLILSVFLVALAFVGVAHSRPDSDEKTDDEDSQKKLKEVANMLNEKFNVTLLLDVIKLVEQAKTKCPDLEKRMDDAGDKVTECVEKVDRGSETLCSLVKKHAPECTKPVVDVVTACLPEESKDLPAMMVKMILAIVDQACHSTVEEILELLNPCVMKKDFESFPACGEIKTVIDEHRNKLPSKSLVCSMLPKVRSCAKSHQEASCSNPITKKAVMKFHDAVDAAVKDECDALNKA